MVLAKQENIDIIWLLDEPGRDLHSSTQIDLKNLFEDVSMHSQIIYTTHQPMMIPWHRLERINVVENIEANIIETHGTVINERFWSDYKGENSAKSPLGEALSLIVGSEFILGKEHVIVEGISDYFYLTAWVRFFQDSLKKIKWPKSFNLNDRIFIAADGVTKIPVYMLFLLRSTPNDFNCISLIDSKNETAEIKEVVEKFGSGLKERVFSYSEILPRNQIEEIEHLFTTRDYIDLCKEYYSTYQTNIKTPPFATFKPYTTQGGKITKYVYHQLHRFNPDLKSLDKTGIAMLAYSKLISSTICPFSNETKNNFMKILKFIDKKVKL